MIFWFLRTLSKFLVTIFFRPFRFVLTSFIAGLKNPELIIRAVPKAPMTGTPASPEIRNTGVQKVAKKGIYLTPYIFTEQIFDNRPFMYNKIFLKKLF